MRRSGPLAAVFCALLLAGGASSTAQELEKPLPELHGFLDEVRHRLRSDELLLSQYTFTEKHIERHLDSRGNVKKSSSALYEVYPSFEPGHTYRKLVERDGRRLAPGEIEKEDRKHQEKIARLDAPGEAAEQKRQAKLGEARRREARIVDEMFRLFDIRMTRRELVEGRSTILLTFRPRPDFTPDGRAGKILKRFAGRAWIDENDRQLVRLETELIDNLSIGFGVLARLNKGATASFTRRKVNGEIWLPAEARFRGNARLLLVKGLRIDAISEYSDYRKFSVGTSDTYTPENTSSPY